MRDMAAGVKKWFMLQMWRVQQIAQIATIILLALNLSLQVYNFMSWRGSVMASPYTGVPLILLVLVAVIWVAAIIWDMRMKMWREQMTVIAERNPYMREKMSTKEVVLMGLTWLPLLDKLGKDDPEVRASAAALRKWIGEVTKADPFLAQDIKEVHKLTGKDPLH